MCIGGENLRDKRLRIIAALFIFLYLLGDGLFEAYCLKLNKNDNSNDALFIWVLFYFCFFIHLECG